MTQQDLPSALVSFIPTVEEASLVKEQLEDVLEGKYKVKVSPIEIMQKKLSYSVQTGILELYHNTDGQDTDTERIYAFLEEVKKTLESLPTLTLQIAISPTQHLLEVISSWVEENLKTPHLLELVVKKELIAGATVAYDGRVKNYSLSKKLPETVLQ